MAYQFLRPGDLAYMRQVQKDLIDNPRGTGTGDTCTIKRPTRVSDGLGGWTESFAVQNNVPCRLWISSGPNGTSESTAYWADQELEMVVAFMIFYWNADVQIGDYLLYHNAELNVDKEFRTVGIQNKDTITTAIRMRVEAVT